MIKIKTQPTKQKYFLAVPMKFELIISLLMLVITIMQFYTSYQQTRIAERQNRIDLIDTMPIFSLSLQKNDMETNLIVRNIGAYVENVNITTERFVDFYFNSENINLSNNTSHFTQWLHISKEKKANKENIVWDTHQSNFLGLNNYKDTQLEYSEKLNLMINKGLEDKYTGITEYKKRVLVEYFIRIQYINVLNETVNLYYTVEETVINDFLPLSSANEAKRISEEEVIKKIKSATVIRDFFITDEPLRKIIKENLTTSST